MQKQAIYLGSLFAGLAVVIGAFGAHYLKTILTPDQLSSFETGVKYQFYHSFAIFICGIISTYSFCDAQKIKYAMWSFVIGIVCFSGSIYLLNLLKSKELVGIKGLGILTPIGGLFFITAWVLVAISCKRKMVEPK
jgi:uncharacterized membrane protein YgdD (TMEM256/DUF423 family)